MIRTRDFILYCVILVFLLMGAIYTGFMSLDSDPRISKVAFDADTTTTLTAYTEETEDSFTERITSLRAKLSSGEGVIESAPPVFTSVDQLRAQEAASSAAAVATSSVGTREVQYCGAPIVPAILATWPTITNVQTVEGEAVFYTEATTEVAVGTTTSTVVETVAAFTLPIRSIRTGFDSCLPDILIGATTAGGPLLNTSVTRYSSVSAATQIGYIRDGFPLYGPVPDETLLDSCGGQMVNGAYQYHVRPSEPMLIACYAGIPATISL